MNHDLPQRHTPAKGVHLSLGGPNWVFLTVCTEQRERWLIQPSVQSALHSIWENTATAWLVSDYLLMPDHLHLFCAPRDLKFTIERWIGFWKDQFAKKLPVGTRCRASGGGAAAPPCQDQESVGTRYRVFGGGAAAPPYQDPKIVIGKFQRGGFHHRLRGEENYHEKWLYVQENPVRAGLAAKPEDWPYQGRVHGIHW